MLWKKETVEKDSGGGKKGVVIVLNRVVWGGLIELGNF